MCAAFIQHKPVWQIQPLSLDQVRDFAESMETETKQLLSPRRHARRRCFDPQLLGDLAEAEAVHEHRADQIAEENLPANVRAARMRMRGGFSCCG